MNLPSAELIELCGAVRDETATPEQIARLEALLAGDPEARRFYRRFTQISAMLERYEQAPIPRSPSPVSRSDNPPPRQWFITTASKISVFLRGRGAAAPRRQRDPNAAEVSRPRGKFALALAAGLALLATAIVFLKYHPRAAESASRPAPAAAGSAPLALIQDANAGVLIPRTGSPVQLKGVVPLHEGEIVATSANGSAVIRFPREQTLFILTANTRAWLSHEGASKIVHLTTGQLYCDVATQSEGAQWRILTSDGEARVLGTRLAVSARDDGTRVAVTSGRVRVIARDSRQSVDTNAGFAAQLTPTTATVTRLPPTEPTRVSSFTLVDPRTNQTIPGFEAIEDGTVLDLASLPTRKINIRANCEPQLVGAVRFTLTGTTPAGEPLKLFAPLAHSFPNQIEIYYPYMMAGDPSILGERLPDRSYAWEPPIGRYTLTAVPYAVMKDAGARGEKLAIQFEVVDGASAR